MFPEYSTFSGFHNSSYGTQYNHIPQYPTQQHNPIFTPENNVNISSYVPNQALMFRNNLTQIAKLRNRFSKEEDDYLKYLVEVEYANNHSKITLNEEPNWNEISAKMFNRTARQCRERYRNYLQPGICNGPWSQEEEELLQQKYREIGPQWSKMAKFFPNRSDVNIKNHYTCLLNRQSRINFINSFSSSHSSDSSSSSLSSSPVDTRRKSSFEQTTRNGSQSQSISSLNITSTHNNDNNENMKNEEGDKKTGFEDFIDFDDFFTQNQMDENSFNEEELFVDPFYQFEY
ncbi:Myb-like DNA-binding domain containing protein [Tritrichomonas foetus]|uniref:Myb-like DNA-binding domain containing protein n=1 Tax=Tritrichomonas foetus TaxID=1144522 RepID=A0A1J4J312_9EUKA|nr:Myb-like DNA-binding domain containing protein [Tritrichomonas foetus]|eukprot:OHS93814.1 Myb-like DNA-binding domain containing protein [Tritrichomonas foetus]